MGAFKVIIIGGGPVGMVLANALQACGIDFVLAEKRSTIPPATAFGLLAWPHCCRLFHQLGLLEGLEKISAPLNSVVHTDKVGTVLHTNQDSAMLSMAYGYPQLVCNRGDFGRLLEGAIRDRSKIKVGKRLKDIESNDDGVKAVFEDGTTESGSIVIGADGIWSTVRDLMVTKAPPGLFDAEPFRAEFSGMYGRAPRIPDLDPGHMIFVHGGEDGQLQIFSQADETHMITYKRMPAVRERTMLSDDAKCEAIVAPWLDVPLTPTTNFGDLWRGRTLAGGANFDEGIAKLWHWGRVVLVGDAVHKVLPNQGTGANSGIESAVCLVNHLSALLDKRPDPRTKQLRSAFEAYQDDREAFTRNSVTMARYDLDLYSNDTGPLLKAARILGRRIPMAIAQNLILDAVPFDDERESLFPGKNTNRTQDRPLSKL